MSVNRQLFSLKVTSLITQKVVTENEMKREYVSPERTLPRDPTELEKPTAIPARSADSREQSLVNSNALSDHCYANQTNLRAYGQLVSDCWLRAAAFHIRFQSIGARP